MSHHDHAVHPPLLSGTDTFGVIGTGVMGRTILKGLFDAGALTRDRAWGTARSAASCEAAADALGIAVETDVRDRIPGAGVIVLAVKPAQAARAITALREAGLQKDTLLISILAGTTLKQLDALTEQASPWVRAMPNTPCVVREGMTVVCGGANATAAHIARARQVFECVGRCLQADEAHFNAITALSGSGPAYQFLIMEAMADAGVRVGLPRDLALTLVSQTALGAARMIQTSGRHPAALRDDVTTPAGCTIGGLLMLEDGKIRSVLARAIEEATRIAAQLGAASAK
ncbi:MAG: pyrroline-5-carboxylate reductase [Vicinamibacterales bacterium]